MFFAVNGEQIGNAKKDHCKVGHELEAQTKFISDCFVSVEMVFICFLPYLNKKDITPPLEDIFVESNPPIMAF